MKTSVGYALLTLLAAAPVFAQSGSSGEIRGRVSDSSQAAVPGSSVLITNLENEWSLPLTTNEMGNYRALELRPGSYVVRVTMRGFQGQKTPVQIAIGQSRILNFELKSGPPDPVVVDVVELPQLAETLRSQQSNTVDEKTIRGIPMDLRNFLTIAGLVPGVADSEALADATDYRVVQAAHSGISFHGNNGRGNSFIVDGGEANDSGGGVRPTLSQEAVEQFQVNRSNYSAELGSASGGVINIVSRTGTNGFHGSAFGFFRTDRLDAADPFARNLTAGKLTRIKPNSDRQQFGVTLGGPLLQSRTFFFSVFEGLRRDESNSVALLTDPSIFDPTPDQEAILSGLPSNQAAQLRQSLTTLASTRQLFEQNSGVFPYAGSDYKFSLRIDHRLAARDQVLFRYNAANLKESNPNSRALVGASRSIDSSRLDHTGMLSWTRFVSPSTINKVQYQFNYGSFKVSTAEKFGPEININGYGFFNRDVLLPSNILWRRHDFSERLTLAFGAHELRMGGQLLIRENHVESHAFLAGRFNFGELNGGHADSALASTSITALQAFNLGLPGSYQQGFGNPNVFSTEPYLGIFVQDRWRLTDNLTLDFGLRYELDDLRDPIKTDTNNVAPRFGFAWDPLGDHRTTIRGGYGIFYAPTSYALAATVNLLGEIDGYRQVAQVLALASAPNIFQTLRSQGVIGVPTPTRSITPADLSQFGITIAHDGPRPAFTVLFKSADDFASSYSQQASLGIEREITSSWFLSANYLYVRGLKIMRARDVNLLPAPVSPTLGIRVWSPAFFRDPMLLQDNVYESSGNSFYHGLTVETAKDLTRHVRLNVNYTLSKAIDEVVDYNSDFQANDQLNLRGERALSSFHQRHKLVAYAFLESPLEPGNGALSDILGDFTLAPIVRFSSGRPFNLLVGSELNMDRHSTTDRPALAGRNTGTGPDFWTVDARVTRTLPVGGAKIELMVEAFNLFNRLNFRSVNNIVGKIAPPFDLRGRKDRSPSVPLGFTSAFDARRIQLGVRVSF